MSVTKAKKSELIQEYKVSHQSKSEGGGASDINHL